MFDVFGFRGVWVYGFWFWFLVLAVVGFYDLFPCSVVLVGCPVVVALGMEMLFTGMYVSEVYVYWSWHNRCGSARKFWKFWRFVAEVSCGCDAFEGGAK